MTATIHAFFENGLFRPVEPVGLPERSLDRKRCQELLLA
jgi:predicted DNA-binding antitoxin AbrB/MazE fold protein